MLLKEYITKYRIDPVRFAVDCEVSPASMYNYLNGSRKPHQSAAERIEKNSDKLVSVIELRGKDDRDKRRRKDDYYASCVATPCDKTSDLHGFTKENAYRTQNET